MERGAPRELVGLGPAGVRPAFLGRLVRVEVGTQHLLVRAPAA